MATSIELEDLDVSKSCSVEVAGLLASSLEDQLQSLAILIRRPNKIRLVGGSPTTADALRNEFNKHPQLEFTTQDGDFSTTFSFKHQLFLQSGQNCTHCCAHGFKGGERSAVAMRRAFGGILGALQNMGWRCVATSNLGQRCTNSTLFLRRCGEANSLDGRVFCVAPSADDNVLLIDVPTVVAEEIITAAQSQFSHVEFESVVEEGDRLTGRLKLASWDMTWDSPGGEQAHRLKKFILEIFRTCYKNGNVLVCGINFKGTADSLYFQHTTDSDRDQKELFLLSPSRSNRIRLLAAPVNIVELVKEVANSEWGVRGTGQHYSQQELELEGSPWWPLSVQEEQKARHLMSSIIAALVHAGWSSCATINISRAFQSKSVFIFQRSGVADQLDRPSSLVLSLHKTNRLRIQGLPELGNPFVNTVLGLADVSDEASALEEAEASTKEWKLVGRPLHGGSCYTEDQTHFVLLLLVLLSGLYSMGWQLVSSANLSGKYHARSDRLDRDRSDQLHTWILLHTAQGSEELAYLTERLAGLLLRYRPAKKKFCSGDLRQTGFLVLATSMFVLTGLVICTSICSLQSGQLCLLLPTHPGH